MNEHLIGIATQIEKNIRKTFDEFMERMKEHLAQQVLQSVKPITQAMKEKGKEVTSVWNKFYSNAVN